MVEEKTGFKKIFKNYRTLILLIIGITVGTIIGLIFKERAVVLKPFGQLFLNMMFTAVVPLVFFSLASSVAKMTNMHRLGKILSHTLIIFIVTAIIASIFIIIVVSIVPPAEGVDIDFGVYEEPESLNFLDQVVEAVSVEDFADILSRQAMLPLIIFSIAIGYSISFVSKDVENNPVIKFFEIMNDAFMKLINLIMLYAPIGLGAYFAALVGDYGSDILGAYGRAVIMFFPICIAYFLVGFTLYAYFAGGGRGYKSILQKYITTSSNIPGNAKLHSYTSY